MLGLILTNDYKVILVIKGPSHLIVPVCDTNILTVTLVQKLLYGGVL
jgi:hypothetical protein